MHWLILFFILVWPKASVAQDVSSWVLPLYHLGKEEPHCTAVLIGPRKALTARHCLPTSDTLAVASSLKDARRISVTRSDVIDDAALFPLNDVAVLHLGEAMQRSSFPRLSQRSPKPGQILTGYGFGLQTSCHGKDCARLKRWKVRVEQILDGKRLFALFAGVTVSGDDPCLGDSGGPLFQKNGKNHDLVGLVAGQSPELYPGAGFCRFRTNLFTTVSSFRPWIEEGHLMRMAGASHFLRGWDERCRGESPNQASWAITQSILFQLARSMGGWKEPRIQQAFLHCRGLDQMVQEHLQRGEGLTIHPARLLEMSDLLQGIRRLELVQVENEDLKRLKSLPQLEQLTLIGLDANLDLRWLKPLQNLSELTLKHGAVRHLEELKRGLPRLKRLEVYDIESQ